MTSAGSGRQRTRLERALYLISHDAEHPCYCEATTPPGETAPQAAPFQKITGTVTMPTRETESKPLESLMRVLDLLGKEATLADGEADTIMRPGWRNDLGWSSETIERQAGYHRGYASGMRVAALIVARVFGLKVGGS